MIAVAQEADPKFQQIVDLEKPKPLVQGFTLLAMDELVTFAYDPDNNQFKLSRLFLKLCAHHTRSPPICAISLIADYKNQYFKQRNVKGDFGASKPNDDDVESLDKDHTLKHLILTGHKDGKVLIWRLSNYIGIIDDYGCEVTAMSPCFEGIAFATIEGHIYIWDMYLLKCSKSIDIY